MSDSTRSIMAIKFEAYYKLGVEHRRTGKTITTKAQFLHARANTEPDHSLILDLYLAYTKGYRATAPAPLVMSSYGGTNVA